MRLKSRKLLSLCTLLIFICSVLCGCKKEDTENEKNKSGLININTASKDELTELTGVGPKIAERIIEYRKTHGGFSSKEEILNVKGIGEKIFEKFKDYITVK